MKFLIGKMMIKKLNLIFFILFFSLASVAEITVPLPGVPIEEAKQFKAGSKKSPDSAFLPDGQSKEYQYDTKEISTSLPEIGVDSSLNDEITLKESLESNGVKLPNILENGSVYTRYSDEELLSRFHNQGTKSFSFYYIQDTYEVSDSKGIYARTFDNSVPKSMRGGSLHLSFENYWYNKNVIVGWGMNFGIGLSKGNGFFTSSGAIAEQSSTTFSLWTVPVDLGLVFELPLGKWLKVGVSGGPAVMGLYQHRNDKENDEDGKHVRQFSGGFYGRANLKISLSHFTKTQSIKNFKAYDMTKMYLTLEARHQNFSEFQDNVSVSGNSFGAGFSFEYL